MSKSPIIVPTIGRRVWFWPDKRAGQTGFISYSPEVPMDAGIVFVHNDRCVNLDVCDHAGNHHAFTSVFLDQEDDCPHDPDAARCEWMPYQRDQAVKQEAHAKEATGQPRITSHREALEHAAAHALSSRVAEVGHGGAQVGSEVRLALDALLNYGARPVEPASEGHASRVLYPAIRNAMEELAALHPGFNEHVNRAWNYLHGAFWSETPAPASAPSLRVTLATNEALVALPVRDDHRDEPAIAVAGGA